MPPVMLPNKRGPKQATAAQGNFLANRAAQRPTVTPVPAASKPNPFSASGAPTSPAASTGGGQSASGVSTIPSPSSGGAANPQSTGMVPSASGMKRGGPVRKYAAGGTTETNQYGSWGGANAANAVAGDSYTPTTGAGGVDTFLPSSGGPFSTTPGVSPLGGSTTSSNPPGYTGEKPYAGGGMNASPFGIAGNGGPAGGAYFANLDQQFGLAPGSCGGAAAAKGGSIPNPKEEPYRNKWKAKNHAGDPDYKFDDGGGVPDPGGAVPTDPTDPGEMQDTSQSGGDISGALAGVQQAYQYGMQQLSGNIPTTPAGPGGDQTQGGPQDRGNQQIAMDTTGMRPSTNVEDDREASGIGAANQPMPKQGMTPGGVTQGGFGSPQIPQQQFPSGGTNSNTGVYPYNQTIQPIQGARGGSVPSLADGGVMPPPTAPQPQQPTPPPAGGGAQDNAPPQIMRYLAGADAAPIPQVLRRQKSMDPKLSPTARTAHTIASAGGPQQQYATLQAFRRLSDAAGTHAKVALSGNGKIPASLNHAVMFANKKFEYAPSPLHIQFNLKGQKQQAARGGGIQSFDDGGDVGPDPSQQLSDAGAPTQAPSSDSQAPITATVQPLTGGSPQQFDISPDQLQTLVGTQYDKWLTSAADVLNAAVASPTGELGGIGHGNARSLPDISQKAQEQSEFFPGAGYPQTPNTGKLQPENYYEEGPQSNVTPGQQGGNVRTFRPQDATFGVNNQPSGAPVGRVTSSALPPAGEPINNTRDIPGTTIDKNGVRRVTDPEAYDDFRMGRTNFDFNTAPSEQGAKPYSSSAGTPQTELRQQAAEPTDATPIVIRAGVPNNASADERQNLIRAGQQSSSELNQRMIQSTAAASQREQEAMSQQGETERTAMQIRAAKEGEGGARRRRRRH